MNLNKIIVCFAGLAIISGLIACGNGTSKTEQAAPTDQIGQISPQGLAAHELTSKSSGGSNRATVPFKDIKVEKSTARNGYTVGELFEKAASLNRQKVTVKGQVVKVNPNIMGKNWIHIQDGTGDLAKNTHDLVVTSADIAEIGDVISLEGILAADKDFGAGYRYDVIVEDAIRVK
jgi:hypothetical protein